MPIVRRPQVAQQATPVEYGIVQLDTDGLEIPDSYIECRSQQHQSSMLQFFAAKYPKEKYLAKIVEPLPACGYCGQKLRPIFWADHRRTHIQVCEAA